jgi:uncharacterized membrane protein
MDPAPDRRKQQDARTPAHRPGLAGACAGGVLGAGLGAFADGIFLHQILHWHNMGSSVVPPDTREALMRNMVWDGWFHAAALVATIVGVCMLHARALRRAPVPPRSAFSGQLLFGWGAFNLVEGIVDHHLLELHHVRDLPVHLPAWDWGFLAVGGVGFLVVGAWLALRAR